MLTKTCESPMCGNAFETNVHNKRYCSLTCKRYVETVRSRFSYEEEAEINNLFGDDEPEDTGNSGYSTLNEDRVRFIQSENKRLNNLVNKHKNLSDEILDAFESAMAKNLRQITVKPPKNNRKIYSRELVCNPSHSDLQLGKVTPAYNSDIAAERVEVYTDKILQYTDVLSDGYSITRAHVWFLGDIVEGENIFPSQAHVIDSSLYEQVAKNGPMIYMNHIRRLLERFDEVVVVCVIGNHGALTRYSNPESNMDRILYKILEHIFANEPRVTFKIPDGKGEKMFWAVDKIGNYSTLLLHGDQLPVPSSGAAYKSRVLGWKDGAIPERFDDVIMGHYHQNTKMTIGRTILRIAGSPESYNTFAQERLAAMGRPSQHLQFINPEHGVEWEADVYLD